MSPKNGNRSTVIFLKSFVEEEERLGVKYNFGVINNDKRPLLPNKELIGELNGGIGGASTSINNLELSNENYNKLQLIAKSTNKSNDPMNESKLNKVYLEHLEEMTSNDLFKERVEEKLNEKIKNFSNREDLRPSIWCLFSKTGFETHKVEDETRQKLLTCMHYPWLKRLEIWNNINDEL